MKKKIMKKNILILFFTLGGFIYCNAQVVVWSETHEAAAIGATSGSLLYQLAGGTGTVQNATGTGNTTKILKAVHNSGIPDLNVRSRNLSIKSGEEYECTFDISLTNAVHIVSMRLTVSDAATPVVTVTPSSTTSTNGIVITPGKVGSGTTNTFGTTTTTFKIPNLPGEQNNGRISIYQYGAANTLELDNFIITRTKEAPTTWTGGTSAAWITASNWSNGVPIQNSDVTIATGTFQPSTYLNVSIKSLTINSGATLVVNPGYNFTVKEAITNNGTLTIKNNASLIQVDNVANTGVGSSTVNRNSNALSRLDYTIWSSPVASQDLLAFSPATLPTRFYNYNETTNLYNAVPSPSGTPFAAGAGVCLQTKVD